MSLFRKSANTRVLFLSLSLFGSILGFAKISLFSRFLSPTSFSQYVGFFSLVILSSSISGFGINDSLDPLLSRLKSKDLPDLQYECSRFMSISISQSFFSCLIVFLFSFRFNSIPGHLHPLSPIVFFFALWIFSISNIFSALIASYSRVFAGSLLIQSYLSISRTVFLFLVLAIIFSLNPEIGPIRLALIESLTYIFVVCGSVFLIYKIVRITFVLDHLRFIFSSPSSFARAFFSSENLLVSSKARYLNSLSTIILSLPLTLGPFLATRSSDASFASLYAVNLSIANIFILMNSLFFQTVFSDIAVGFSTSSSEIALQSRHQRPILADLLLRIFGIFLVSVALVSLISSLGLTSLLVYSPYSISPLFSCLFVALYLSYSFLSLSSYCLILAAKSVASLLFSLFSSLPFLLLIYFSSRSLSITQFLIFSLPLLCFNFILLYFSLSYSARLGLFGKSLDKSID